jgi:GxxExxY protein
MAVKNYQNLLHKDLSYQIQGAAMEVRKNFGSGHKESLYQNAFAEELELRNIKFEKEKPIKIYSPKTKKFIGLYRPDFIVEGKIIVELKAVEKIPKLFINQLYDYLRNSKYELGYFINFASPKLYIKRVIFTNDKKPFLYK